MRSALLLALLTLQVASVPRAAQGDAVEREWSTRRRALNLESRWAALRAELALESWSTWPRRFDALEALRRGVLAGADRRPEYAAAALAAARDDHPSVRAAALTVLALWGDEIELPADLAWRLSGDDLPAVREALAQALGRVPSPAAPQLLEGLASDGDPRVAEVATAALFALGAPAAEAQLGALLARARAGDDVGLLAALRLWMRTGGERSVLLGLEAWLDGEPAERARSWRAVVRALDLQLFGPRDVTPLLEGWLGSAVWEPRRQEVLVRAGRSPERSLADGLLDALDLVASLERGEDVLGNLPLFAADVRERVAEGRDIELFHLRFDLLDALEAHLGAEGLAARLLTGDHDPQTLEFLLPELGLRVASWNAERDRLWLEVRRPRALRLAAAEGFANTLAEHGDPGAHALLTLALSDPDPVVVRVAFRTLSDTTEPPPPLGALVRAWRRADEEERHLLLPWLPRERPLEPFRNDLLALACCPGPQRALAIELLATFRDDADIQASLADWLEGELDRMGQASEADMRATSLSVIGLLRALRSVAGGAPPEITVRALERSLGRSTDVGKTTAAFLAEGADYARLAPFLAPGTDRRTRIEAAIGLTRRAAADGRGDLLERAVSGLLADFDHAGWDLRVRMIDALGRAATASTTAADFLAQVSAEPLRESEDRKRALEALARAGVLEPLRVAASTGFDVDARLVALRLLAAAPGEDLSCVLAGLAAERLLDEDRARLRVEILAALAGHGRLGPELEDQVLAAPRAAAADTLARRFAGERVPEAGFSWRGEIQALEHLARAGRLQVVLGAEDLVRLDAALLAALAKAALRARDWDQAWRLHRAALVAAEGDPKPSAGKLAGLRCRLFGLAWRTERWREAERMARDLLGAWRRRELPETVWDEVFGAEDPEAGIDPAARLASAADQAAAWAALADGDLPRATELARRAATRQGDSRAAAEEQERLESALAAARQAR